VNEPAFSEAGLFRLWEWRRVQPRSNKRQKELSRLEKRKERTAPRATQEERASAWSGGEDPTSPGSCPSNPRSRNESGAFAHGSGGRGQERFQLSARRGVRSPSSITRWYSTSKSSS